MSAAQHQAVNQPLIDAINKIRNRTPEIVAAEWLAQKRLLTAAQAALDALSTELVGMTDAARSIEDEGSKTYTLDGFKVEVKRAISRKAVKGGIEEIQKLALNELTPLKTKVEIDDTGVKYLKNNHPKIYAKVAKFIESKPSKIGVTVTRID